RLGLVFAEVDVHLRAAQVLCGVAVRAGAVALRELVRDVLARRAERIGALDVRRAPHLREDLDDAVLADRAGARAGEDRERFRTPLLAHRLHLRGDLVKRLLPGDRLEAAFAARADTLERARQAPRIVVDLQRKLRLRADLALQHRVFLVARDLHKAAILEMELGRAGVEADVAAARHDAIRIALRARQAVGKSGSVAAALHRLLCDRRAFAAQHCVTAAFARKAVEIDGRGSHQEMVVVTDATAFGLGFREMLLARAERDGVPGADARAGRRSARGAAIGAQVALHRMMVDAVVAHRAVRTGDHAFPASG